MCTSYQTNRGVSVGMTINAASYSSIGNRPRNEDNLLLFENGSSMIAAVADGLGGEGNGDIASQIAIQTLSTLLSDKSITIEEIEKAILRANEEIVNLHGNGNKMKSTVAVLWLKGSHALAATVGDTRIYQFRKGEVVFQSTDHSVSQMSVSVGEISADKIRGHVDRHRLTRSLGSQKTVEADLTELISLWRDAFLLCSDGFWELILEEEMLEDLVTSESAEEWLNKMRGRVESRIPPTGDNHSAIAIIMTAKGRG